MTRVFPDSFLVALNEQNITVASSQGVQMQKALENPLS